MSSDYAREYSAEVYKWRKKHKICTCCGKEKAEEGKTLCLICKMDGRERKRSYYQNLPLDKKQEMLAKKKAVREERRAKGLCYNCEEPVFRSLYCKEHYKKHRANQNRYNRKYKEKMRGVKND